MGLIMKAASFIPKSDSNLTGVWRRGRLAPPTAILIMIAGFATMWASANRDHPARVSFLDGRATYEASGDVDWNEVTLNLPLVSGDRIIAHPDSRVEVELGDGNLVRISGETDVLFPELSKKKTILKIHEGDLILRVKDARQVQVELEQGSVKIRKRGLYRIQVDPDGSICLVVHEGRAEVSSRHGKERVEPGRELVLNGRQIGIQALARDLDEFEKWSGSRDAVMVSSRSVGYMGRADFPGVQSLDNYGYWADYGSYGNVWIPDVSSGWAPFRFGQWRYLSTGLTWVSSEPWGWLPYHYGNWVYYRALGRWAWVPGNFKWWRPSLVDFFSGNGFVAWAPKGYYESGNRQHIHNWDRRYHPNGLMPNGLTVVNRNNLGRGPAQTRVVASDAVVGGLRRGLPRDLRRSRVWNRNSEYPRSGVRASRLASRSTANSREGVVQGGGLRRSTVSRRDTDGPRTRQSVRSNSRNRSLTRTSSGSRGSFSTRSGRNASRPSVWSSRRSKPATSPTFTSPSGRSSSRSISRTPYPSRPAYRSTPTYRSQAPSVRRSASPRIQSAPRQSGSSGGGTRSRSTNRNRN